MEPDRSCTLMLPGLDCYRKGLGTLRSGHHELLDSQKQMPSLNCPALPPSTSVRHWTFGVSALYLEPRLRIAPHEKLLNCLQRLPALPSCIPQSQCKEARFSGLREKPNMGRHVDLRHWQASFPATHMKENAATPHRPSSQAEPNLQPTLVHC